MRKIFLLLALIPLFAIGQTLNCSDIGLICDKAQELMNKGEYDKALDGLNKAKQLPSLQGCPGISRINGLISRIQNRNSGSGSPSTASNLTFTVKGVRFTMVYVNSGTFTMGATSEQGSDVWDDEKPAHSVTVGDFWIGETEVTQALWQAVMGRNPSEFKGRNRPVENVSWNDCQSFVKKLNSLLSSKLPAGRKFRLPTEAEWEFAARGGNRSGHYKFSGSNDIGSVAWYLDNSGSTTHDVKTKNSNELCIYDMTGNVWEWCQDWFASSYYGNSPQTNPTGPSSGSGRVYRGSCWGSDAKYCRVSNRCGIDQADTVEFLGLRLAL